MFHGRFPASFCPLTQAIFAEMCPCLSLSLSVSLSLSLSLPPSLTYTHTHAAIKITYALRCDPVSLSRTHAHTRHTKLSIWIVSCKSCAFMSSIGKFKVQGFFICHMINYTGYNQKWNVGQIRSAQWTVQRIKKNKKTLYKSNTTQEHIYIGKKRTKK